MGSSRRSRRVVSTRSRRRGRAAVIAGLAILVGLLALASVRSGRAVVPEPVASSDALSQPAALRTLSDDELQRAADGLLGAVSPRLPENGYFPAFARERLDWMEQQVRAGRLTIAFLFDPETIRLPPTVLMSASHLDGQPTIFIVKPRFEKFLEEGGRTSAPFTPEQKNDFAIGLVHEVSHLQNTSGPERDPERFYREEARAWREVTLEVVRPLRRTGQPVNHRLAQVDDVLRACGDVLPCPQLARFVRLTR